MKWRVHVEQEVSGFTSWVEAAYIDVEAETKEEAESKALAIAKDSQDEGEDIGWEVDPAASDMSGDDFRDPEVKRSWEVKPHARPSTAVSG